jgi:hypothetical protein
MHYPESAPRIKGTPVEAEEHYREFALSVLVADTPKSFWQRLLERTTFTYGDAYSAVKADPALLAEQRDQKLYQERYFKLEHALITAANETGMPASAKLVGMNLCYYAYVARGRVGLTQSYVQATGEMPTPAAFRKQLAEMAEFKRVLRLPLSDESIELMTPKRVSGIVLHSPIGRKFNDEDQKLGGIGFFVPYDDYSGWAAQLAFHEFIAAYKPEEEREDRAAPTPKKIAKTGTEE